MLKTASKLISNLPRQHGKYGGESCAIYANVCIHQGAFLDCACLLRISGAIPTSFLPMKKLLWILLAFTLAGPTAEAQSRKAKAGKTAPGTVWSAAKANDWYRQHAWISGANFIPSTAINQLEMWQAATFDPQTIDRELGWAEGIGFNTMRVFLHHLAWEQDPQGFKKRMQDYLAIADRHHIQTIFVFFDDCWNKEAKPGPQPAPKTGIHNSGWLQDPGEPTSRDSTQFGPLQRYVTDVLTDFRSDKRVLLWDLYNEPGNSDKKESSLPLVRNVFRWARAVNPEQPRALGFGPGIFKS